MKVDSGATDDPMWDGNSISLELENKKYIFIEECVYSFETRGDKIENFTSNMGNNRVPYQSRMVKKYAFYLIENQFIPSDSAVDENTQNL